MTVPTMLQRLAVLLFLVRAYAFAPLNNRIFVGGNFGTIDNLARMFRTYGRIEEIRVEDDFAFVTFVTAESADAALRHACPEMEVRPSQPVSQLGIESCHRTVEQWEEMMHIAHNSNFAIQVATKHLIGLQHYCNHHMEGVKVSGVLDIAGNDLSMLYVKTEDHDSLVDKLYKASFLKYNEMYPLQNGILRGSILDLARQAWGHMEKFPKMSAVRAHIFPPTIKDAVLAGMEEFCVNSDIRLSSIDYTHVYSVVGLTANGSDDRGGVFMVGFSHLSSPLSKSDQASL